MGQERQESWTLDMIHSEQLDLNRFAAEKTNNVSREEAGEEAYQVQTKTLYGIAKGFLEEMKQMGQAMS